jgi:hypothetical protein
MQPFSSIPNPIRRFPYRGEGKFPHSAKNFSLENPRRFVAGNVTSLPASKSVKKRGIGTLVGMANGLQYRQVLDEEGKCLYSQSSTER